MLKTAYNPDVLTCLANLSNDEVFTSPTMANDILDMLPADIWKDKNATFLDPVCKSGVFLREMAKRLMKGLEKQIPDKQKRIDYIFQHQLYGIAITELTSLLSRRSVYCSKKADGKYSVCESFGNSQGNIIFSKIKHHWQHEQCKYCGASQDVYERSSELETHAYQFIHTEEPDKLFNMRFDVIVGNPPYQLSDAGYGTSASPIYDKFVLQAKKLNPRYLTMIIPARWFSGGKGLDEFRDEMLKDNRIREIHDFPEATDCFAGVQIKGGVCYFLWDRDNKGLCKVTNYSKGKRVSTMERPLLEEGCDTFIRYNEAISILKKVQKKKEPSIKEEISARKPFGLPTTFKGKTKPFKNCITLFQNGGVGYIEKNSIEKNKELIEKFKVLIPRAGSGSDSFPHPILGKPFVAEPESACTETYIVAGAFENKKKALNLCTYINTQFFRLLVLLIKSTQDATSRVYGFVPTQDMNQEWDDAKLYKKYGLTAEEIAFIGTLIRPMD